MINRYTDENYRSSLPPESVTSGKKVKQNPRLINVFCRLRPVGQGEKASSFYVIGEAKDSLEIDAPDDIIKKNQNIKLYRFTRVFSKESSQIEVYEETVQATLKSVLNEQKNGLIFSYGVTNAGKTHTIVGNQEDMGILPRLLNDLMNIKNSILNKVPVEGVYLSLQEETNPLDLMVSLECFEIYNEEIFDLMVEQRRNEKNPKQNDRQKLKLRDINKKLIIEDLRVEELKSIEGTHATISKCLKNRQVASTMLNSSSSRSHTIFRINIKSIHSDSENIIEHKLGYICVVDLAGSERAKRTETAEGNLKEAGGINSSLLVLGRCLNALKKELPVPFRDSKLTHFLSEFFVDNSNITMITNINPREEDCAESLRVLNYSSLAKEVKILVSELKSIRMEDKMKQRMESSISIATNKKNNTDAKTNEPEGRNTRVQSEAMNNKLSRNPSSSSLDELELVNKLCDRMVAEVKAALDEHMMKWNQQDLKFKDFSVYTNSGAEGEGEGPRPSRRRVFLKDQCNQTSPCREETPPKKKTVKQSSSPTGRPRCNSDDKKKNSNLHRISIKQRTNPQDPASTPHPRSSSTPFDTPLNNNKAKKSTFYNSLVKDSRDLNSLAEKISLREYHKEMKGKYETLLDICDGNEEEARQFFKQEHSISPDKFLKSIL